MDLFNEPKGSQSKTWDDRLIGSDGMLRTFIGVKVNSLLLLLVFEFEHRIVDVY